MPPRPTGAWPRDPSARRSHGPGCRRPARSRRYAGGREGLAGPGRGTAPESSPRGQPAGRHAAVDSRMRPGIAARTVPPVDDVVAPRPPGRQGGCCGCRRCSLGEACSRDRSGRRRSGRSRPPSGDARDRPVHHAARTAPRSEPGADEDQEDALIFGRGVGEKLPDLLGRVDARLDPAEDHLGINRALGRRDLGDRVRRDQPLILGRLQDAVQERAAGHDGSMLQLLAAQLILPLANRRGLHGSEVANSRGGASAPASKRCTGDSKYPNGLRWRSTCRGNGHHFPWRGGNAPLRDQAMKRSKRTGA
jgi:hypothetical protein